MFSRYCTMENLRVIDEAGNRQDYKTEFVPRIGERVVLEYGEVGRPVVTHYFRVKDAAYHLQNAPYIQAVIFVVEETNPELWPS
jgi:hypothetical protein